MLIWKVIKRSMICIETDKTTSKLQYICSREEKKKRLLICDSLLFYLKKLNRIELSCFVFGIRKSLLVCFWLLKSCHQLFIEHHCAYIFAMCGLLLFFFLYNPTEVSQSAYSHAFKQLCLVSKHKENNIQLKKRNKNKRIKFAFE